LGGERSGSSILNFLLGLFLGGGESAYVPLKTCGTGEGIELVRELGGVPILPHPGRVAPEVLDRLLSLGLLGVKAYSSQYNPDETRRVEAYSEEKGLLITAGSDFREKRIKPDVELERVENNGYQWVEGLYANHGRRESRR